MPANNRRGGSRHRVSHLREAPPPAADKPATSVAEEEAPFATTGNVAITLTPDEYLELINQRPERPDANTSIELLAVPDEGSPDQVDDEDARFEAASRAPRASRIADDALGDQACPANATRPAQLEPSTVEEPQPHSHATPSPAAPTDDHDHDHDDVDVDPTFEKLALASTTVPRAPTLGVRGSASIDSPAIRPPRKRALGSSDARPQRGGVRCAGGRPVIATLVVLVAVIAGLVVVTLPQRPSRFAAAASQRGALSEFATLGLGVQGQAFGPKAAELAAASTRAHAPAGRQPARRSLMHRRGSRAAARRRSARPKQRHTVITPQRTESAPVRTVPAVAPILPTANAPASSAATSSTTSDGSGSGGSASPPAYGEGGVLGAGHAG